MKTRFMALVAAVLLWAVACGGDDTTQPTTSTVGTPSSVATGGSTSSGGNGGAATSSGGNGGSAGAGPFELTSSDFVEAGMIPAVHQCSNPNCTGGMNISPQLSWTAGPMGTMSYAVVMRDLDFMNGFVHWVVWDIPATVTSLPQNMDANPTSTDVPGAKQSQGGYFGMCSCGMTAINTYQFTVYALDVATVSGIMAGATRPAAETAVTMLTPLATATLSGES